MSKSVYVLGAVRTPLGKLGGALAALSAAELGAVAAKASLERSKVKPNQINKLILGCARQAGVEPNVARQIGHKVEIPDEIPAFTVNEACGSGLKAIVLGYQAIQTGEAEIILAGGSESMSNIPYYLRWGYRSGQRAKVETLNHNGFQCPLCCDETGQTAENLATKYHITRDEQDRYAAGSQRRCEMARKVGQFKDEIVPVIRLRPLLEEIPGQLQPESDTNKNVTAERFLRIDTDENPRDNVTLEELSQFKPMFREDGTVHKGNSCSGADGAATLILASEAKVRTLNLIPAGRLIDYSVAMVEPIMTGIAPVSAVNQLIQKTGLSLEEIDLMELNEAFAAQVLACQRELKFDLSKINVNGGAIALGHPIGATGARIVVTLLFQMQNRNLRRGIATLCVSRGTGLAALFERG